MPYPGSIVLWKKSFPLLSTIKKKSIESLDLQEKGMRKKIRYGIAFLLLVLIVGAIWGPVKFGMKEERDIASPIYNVGPQLTGLKNWKNWYPEISSLDSHSIRYSPAHALAPTSLQAGDFQFTILEGNPAYALVREEGGGKIEYHSLYVIPDSTGYSSHVIWIRALSPMKWLKEKIYPDHEMKTGLDRLKHFMEDTHLYYGYPIVRGPVEDTLVLTLVAKAPKNDSIEILLHLYQEIKTYGLQNRLDTSQPLMATFSPAGPDSIRVAAGIPVIQKGPEKKGITFLSMPRRGWMLTSIYEGSYGGLNSLYRAMEKYISDKHIQRAALPYEKYLSGPPSMKPAENARMRIKLYYPVF
jgi:effector-binding domain-containing protein